MKRLIVNNIGGVLYMVAPCPACDNYGAPVIGSEPIYADTGDGYGPRIVGYEPVFGDYCTCHYGQALKKQHELRDAAQFFGEVADHYAQMAAQAADEEAARIDCGGGW